MPATRAVVKQPQPKTLADTQDGDLGAVGVLLCVGIATYTVLLPLVFSVGKAVLAFLTSKSVPTVGRCTCVVCGIACVVGIYYTVYTRAKKFFMIKAWNNNSH